MSEIRLHTESFGELLLLPEVPCLLIRWHGFANSYNLHLLLEKGLELYQHYAPLYPRLGWLSDTRSFGAMLPRDQEWAATDWNPRAYKVGLRELGFLVPDNIFGQIAIQRYEHNTAQRNYALEVKYYASLEEACQYMAEER